VARKKYACSPARPDTPWPSSRAALLGDLRLVLDEDPARLQLVLAAVSRLGAADDREGSFDRSAIVGGIGLGDFSLEDVSGRAGRLQARVAAEDEAGVGVASREFTGCGGVAELGAFLEVKLQWRGLDEGWEAISGCPELRAMATPFLDGEATPGSVSRTLLFCAGRREDGQ
jgi:hypothetical protein